MKIKPHLLMRDVLTLGSLLAAAIMLLGYSQSVCAQWSTSGTNVYYNGGNVGIGTTGPIQQLQIMGPSAAASPTSGVLGIGDPTVSGGAITLGYLTGSYSYLQGWGSKPLYINPLGNNVIFNRDAGNVGIGTTSPSYKFEVNGSVGVSGGSGVFKGDGASTGGSLQLWKDAAATKASNVGMSVPGGSLTDDLIFSRYGGSSWLESMRVQNSTGNVGIGTTSPAVKLDVAATSADAPTRVAEFYQTGLSTAGTYAFTSVGKANAADSAAAFGFLMNTAGNDSAFVTVAGDDPAAGTGLFVRKGGNVGIGLTNPQYKLDVAGNTNVSGNITATGSIAAKYQDVAEWVPSSEQPTGGTVVVLDTTKSNQVVSSSEAYDTRVAGVVSEQPGIALGESGAGKVLVATTGRVMVKVDASRGPIHIGDLLVTSDRPGLAMKSESVSLGSVQLHRPGTLIGKALEPLEKGSGKILVLLSLQ
jgi:hypothetical protein